MAHWMRPVMKLPGRRSRPCRIQMPPMTASRIPRMVRKTLMVTPLVGASSPIIAEDRPAEGKGRRSERGSPAAGEAEPDVQDGPDKRDRPFFPLEIGEFEAVGAGRGDLYVGIEVGLEMGQRGGRRGRVRIGNDETGEGCAVDGL